MIIELPLRNDLPAYENQVEIDSVTYTLSVSFNDRSQRWTLDIKDINSVTIIAGIPLITSWDLLRQYKANPALPQGEMIMVDTGGENKIADIKDLGDRVVLLYQEAS